MAQYDDDNSRNYEYYDAPSYGYDRSLTNRGYDRRYDGGGSSYPQTDYSRSNYNRSGYAQTNYSQTDYSQTEQERNWTEVLAGGLIAAAGLFLVARGLQERPERRTLLSGNSQGNRQSGRDQQDKSEDSGIQVRESVTIDKPAAELYSYWRDLSNLPDIMRHLKNGRGNE